MNLDALKRPLGIDEIDFRVQSVNKGGYATVLAYKDARADMTRLDEAATPLGWKRHHSNGNANCTVSIWNDETQQWISKEDTGSESYSDKEKGLASDSFKRACFNWGIGRELYDYPVISVKLLDNEFEVNDGRAKATWNLKLKEWTWFSQFKDGKLVYLACKDQNGKKRFVWGTYDPSLVETTAGGKPVGSSPEEETITKSVRGTTDEEEDGNLKALTKSVASDDEAESSEEDKWNELAKEYEELFGKKPRSNMKLENLEAKIQEEADKHLVREEEKTEAPGPVYSDSGDEAEDDPYSAEMESSDEDETANEPEETEEVDVEEETYAQKLDRFKSEITQFSKGEQEAFVKWAKDRVAELSGNLSDDEIGTFRDACNKHYVKIA